MVDKAMTIELYEVADALSEHGVQILNNWYNSIVGMNRITPCNASGTLSVLKRTA